MADVTADNTAAFVYSTLTNATKIVDYEFKGDLPVIVKSVVIAGGAGVNRKRQFATPLGVSTRVSQEQLDFLNSNNEFKRLVSEKWITVVKTGGAWGAPNADKVAADMQQRDGSAPIVPNDLSSVGIKPADVANAGEDGTEPTTLPRTVPLPTAPKNATI